MKEYNKLVRNRVPERIAADNKKFEIHKASEEELNLLLPAKLVEESIEFQSTGDVKELADLLEVIEANAIRKGFTFKQILRMRNEKYKTHGSFSKGIVLERAEE